MRKGAWWAPERLRSSGGLRPWWKRPAPGGEEQGCSPIPPRLRGNSAFRRQDEIGSRGMPLITPHCRQRGDGGLGRCKIACVAEPCID